MGTVAWQQPWVCYVVALNGGVAAVVVGSLTRVVELASTAANMCSMAVYSIELPTTCLVCLCRFWFVFGRWQAS